jgi:hypothetical protein
MSNKLKRNFVDENLVINSFDDIKPYYNNLLQRP